MFAGTDRFGFPDYLESNFWGGDSSSSSVPSPAIQTLDLMADSRPSERMKAGQQMVKLGMGSIAAPIPGNIDEAIGTALVLAGVATIISEAFFR